MQGERQDVDFPVAKKKNDVLKMSTSFSIMPVTQYRQHGLVQRSARTLFG